MCHECLNNDICPSSSKGRKSPNKKSPKKVKEEIKTEKIDSEFETEDFTETHVADMILDSKGKNLKMQKMSNENNSDEDNFDHATHSDQRLLRNANPATVSVTEKKSNKKSPRKVKEEIKIDEDESVDTSIKSVKGKQTKTVNSKVKNDEYVIEKLDIDKKTIVENDEEVKIGAKRKSPRIANKETSKDNKKKS